MENIEKVLYYLDPFLLGWIICESVMTFDGTLSSISPFSVIILAWIVSDMIKRNTR